MKRAAVGVTAVSGSAGQVERILRSVEKQLDGWPGVEVLGVTGSYLEAVDG